MATMISTQTAKTATLESHPRMQAATYDRYGPAEVVQVKEADRPTIAAGEVLVRVRAAGVDRGAWHLMTGRPYLLRAFGFGLRAPKTRVLGAELAGVVEAVAPDVTAFRPGDEVFGVGVGSFAGYARARADRLAPKPANVTFEQAAAVGVSGVTALQAVRDHGHVRPGQDVLVIGASGGVGTFALQIAKASGARVTAVCSTAKVDLARSIGADRVIDYTREDFAAGAQRYDLILDIGGSSTLARLRRVLAENGTLVIVGGEGGDRWFGGMDRQIRAMLLSMFSKQKMCTFISTQSTADLLALGELIEARTLAPVVDTTYPLAQAAAAIRHLAEGRARGKVVITIP